MDILIYPNEILTKKADKVKSITEILPFIPKMKALIKKHNAAGLAAPQVGIGQSFFIVKPRREFERHEVFINPYLVNVSSQKQYGEEGCLSLPGIIRTISRPAKLTIRAFDESNKQFELDLEGSAARIVCHELDHNLGITILDRE